MSPRPPQLLDDVMALAQQAGHAIMEIYGKEIDITRKDDYSPLTQADLAAHHIIDAGLVRLSPGWPVLSEESDATDFSQRRHWNPYWLVDPLDGTREFIKHNDEFTVNIALIEHHRPVMGVVYAPALDLWYYATCGYGAYRRQGSAAPQSIHVRALDPSRLVVAGSRSHGGANMARFLGKAGPHTLMSLGSSLKICLVAEGRADVYPRLGPTSEWDTAAAQCVLDEAGGRLVDINGEPFRYNLKASLLNPWFFACGAGTHDWAQYLDDQT
jgi:3'(2'), 5'-bisphosphate nucleotidase